MPKTRFFGPNDLMGPALAIDSMLYWYSARRTTACLIGYDLMRKTWFMGKFNVHNYGRSYIPEDTGPPPSPSLAHLGSDNFCLFWFSVVKCHPNPTTIIEEDSLTKDEDEDEEYVEEVEEESLRIHCMNLRVTNGSRCSRSGIFPLEICSISCQSYLVAENATYFCDGLVSIHVPKPCIVVGWPEDRVLRRYDVNTKNWVSEEFEIPKTRFFGSNHLMGPALAIDSMLYWYSARHTTACLIGYDLMRKTWFMGKFNVHDYGRSYMPEGTGPPPPPSLAHLGGDKFCLFWFSVVPLNPTFITEREQESLSEAEEEVVPIPLNLESLNYEYLRIHCMKLQVTNGSSPLKSGIFPLKVSAISCQSYLVNEYAGYFCGGLVVRSQLIQSLIGNGGKINFFEKINPNFLIGG
ncbi:unnamed protein product [Camellia sinensis]